MTFIFLSFSTISKAPIDSKVAISVFISFQYSSLKGPVVASQQLGLSSFLATALALKIMNLVYYDLFRCPTASIVICGKITLPRNFTRQNFSYSWSLLFNCHIFQGYVPGIFQTLLVLLVIWQHPSFRHSISHQLHIMRTKIKIILFPIQLVELNLFEFIISNILPYVFGPLISLMGSTLSWCSRSLLSIISYWRIIQSFKSLCRNIWYSIRWRRVRFISLWFLR